MPHAGNLSVSIHQESRQHVAPSDSNDTDIRRLISSDPNKQPTAEFHMNHIFDGDATFYLKLPQQSNSCDCRLFLLTMWEHFATEPFQDLRESALQQYESWFSVE